MEHLTDGPLDLHGKFDRKHFNHHHETAIDVASSEIYDLSYDSPKIERCVAEMMRNLSVKNVCLILTSPRLCLEYRFGIAAIEEYIFLGQQKLAVKDQGLALSHTWKVPGGHVLVEDYFLMGYQTDPWSQWTFALKGSEKPPRQPTCHRTILLRDVEETPRNLEKITCIMFSDGEGGFTVVPTNGCSAEKFQTLEEDAEKLKSLAAGEDMAPLQTSVSEREIKVKFTEATVSAREELVTSRELKVTERETSVQTVENSIKLRQENVLVSELSITERQSDLRINQQAVIDRETEVSSRENSVSQREEDAASREEEVEISEDYVTKREDDVYDREQNVTRREEKVAIREENLAFLTHDKTTLNNQDRLEESQEQRDELDQVISDREVLIRDKEEAIQDREEEYAAREVRIVGHEATLATIENVLIEREHEVGDREQKAAHREQVVTQRESEIRDKALHLRSIQAGREFAIADEKKKLAVREAAYSDSVRKFTTSIEDIRKNVARREVAVAEQENKFAAREARQGALMEQLFRTKAILLHQEKASSEREAQLKSKLAENVSKQEAQEVVHKTTMKDQGSILAIRERDIGILTKQCVENKAILNERQCVLDGRESMINNVTLKIAADRATHEKHGLDLHDEKKALEVREVAFAITPNAPSLKAGMEFVHSVVPKVYLERTLTDAEIKILSDDAYRALESTEMKKLTWLQKCLVNDKALYPKVQAVFEKAISFKLKKIAQYQRARGIVGKKSDDWDVVKEQQLTDSETSATTAKFPTSTIQLQTLESDASAVINYLAHAQAKEKGAVENTGDSDLKSSKTVVSDGRSFVVPPSQNAKVQLAAKTPRTLKMARQQHLADLADGKFKKSASNLPNPVLTVECYVSSSFKKFTEAQRAKSSAIGSNSGIPEKAREQKLADLKKFSDSFKLPPLISTLEKKSVEKNTIEVDVTKTFKAFAQYFSGGATASDKATDGSSSDEDAGEDADEENESGSEDEGSRLVDDGSDDGGSMDEETGDDGSNVSSDASYSVVMTPEASEHEGE